MATLLPNGKQTFIDANGDPLSGGSVTFYVPGTSTYKNTWQDSGQTIINTNPVILDSAGRAMIYGSGAYRQVVKDANGTTIWDQVTADTSSASNSWAGTSAGTANAQTVTASNFTSSDGQAIDLIWGYSNTLGLTVNPNGVGPITVLRDTFSGPVACVGGEAVAGNLGRLVYSSTTGSFHLTSYPLDDRQPFTNLASASTTNLGSLTSRNITITGTTTISSFGSSASTSYPVYRIKFSGILTLTYNAASMILPGSVNITTAANDAAVAIYLGSGNWQIVSYTRASGLPLVTPVVPLATKTSGGSVCLQRVIVQSTTATACATALPIDNTIPQITEGNEVFSQAITPASASSYLLIKVAGSATRTGVSNRWAIALFVDSTANALAARHAGFQGGGNPIDSAISAEWKIASGSTSARTYRVRAGGDAAIRWNGDAGGDIFGGVIGATFIIEEWLDV